MPDISMDYPTMASMQSQVQTQLDKLEDMLDTMDRLVDGAKKNWRGHGHKKFTDSFSKVEADLRTVCECLEKYVTAIKQAQVDMETVDTESAKSTKNVAIEDGNGAKGGGGSTERESYHTHSKVFDDRGLYGGYQGGPASEENPRKKEKYYELIQSNRPNETWDEAKCDEYLKSVQNMGCYYTAYASIIFQHFESDPQCFEEIFGYPMYDENGEFDFNTLIVDMCSYDTSYVDGINVFEVEGTEKFLKGHGIDVEHNKYLGNRILQANPFGIKFEKPVIPENVKELIESGEQIIIGAQYETLVSADGGENVSIGEGHAMLVTGVTEDGRFIVSSWGKKYYLEPCNGNDQYFYTVKINR